MNSVCLVGRLTRDPELKNSAAGTQICSFSLAVQRSYKNQNGEYEADFINCTAFKKTAEFIQKYFSKGSQIAVQGEIRTRKWDDDGKTRYGTDVIVNNVTFVGSSKGGNGQSSDGADIGDLPIPAAPNIPDEDFPF